MQNALNVLLFNCVSVKYFLRCKNCKFKEKEKFKNQRKFTNSRFSVT